jgi:CII-binding regulator of phage lambda lysogenization HflD
VIGRLVPISRPSLPVRWPLSLLADIRTIADSTRVLPDVLERLAAIERRVESLDREVTGMHQGVESIGVDVIQRTAGRLGRITVRTPRSSRAR